MANQHAPQGRVAVAQGQARRTEAPLHLLAPPLGIGALAKSAGLHGEVAVGDAAGQRRHAQPHIRGARAEHRELTGRRVGKVDDAALDKGAAIVDAHRDCAAVGEIDHLDHHAEGQRAMGRGKPLHVVDLAARRGPAVIGMTVPARHAGLFVADTRERGAGGRGGRRLRDALLVRTARDQKRERHGKRESAFHF